MIVWLLSALACSDYGFERDDPGADVRPDVRVAPGEVHFGLVPLGETIGQEIAISNIGDATLTLHQIAVEGGEAFSLAGGAPGGLVAGGVDYVRVDYAALDPDDAGWFVVWSDDPDTPEVRVSLRGEALFPELIVDPDPLDLGQIESGCSREAALTLSNEGLAELVIERVSQAGAGFSIALPAPIALAPGESTAATVRFEASEVGAFEGALEIATNLPTPHTAHQTAETTPRLQAVEVFHQPTSGDEVDVLFYLDLSGSMDDDADNLAANIEQFIATLDGADGDYQVAIATGNDGCHEGEIITADTPDPGAVFSQAAAGTGGSLTEAGLSIALNALQATGAGECNDGFARAGARISIVMISDEPDQSEHDWSHYVEMIQEIAPEAIFSAVAGPVPDGCATATPGDGYWEAVDATGGVFLSICDADWGSHVEELADASFSQPSDTFALEGVPDESTLEVWVDGLPSTAWQWSAPDNAVIFDQMPQGGATIEIHYTRLPDCDG